MSAFDDATAVRVRANGEGTYDVSVDGAWTVGPNRPNGGYLLALLGRAAVTAVGGDHAHPLAASAQYVSPPDVGPATVETDVLRRGRFASQVRARLVQEGRPRVESLFTVGRLAPHASPWWGGRAPVELPPEEECATGAGITRPAGSSPDLRAMLAARFDPATVAALAAGEGGDGEVRAWFRFADGRDPDSISLLLVVDAFPPTTFGIVRTGWIPTLAMNVYVRALPAPGPLRVRFRVTVIQDGVFDEHGEVWDSQGRFVAESTQLAALRLPAG